MPIGLLIPAVVVGVTLVMAAAWWAGAPPHGPLDAQTASARFLVDHPEATIDDVEIAAGGAIALLALADGDVGAVFTIGARLTTRKVDRRGVSVHGDLVQLDFFDHGAPRLRLTVSDAWRERLHA